MRTPEQPPVTDIVALRHAMVEESIHAHRYFRPEQWHLTQGPNGPDYAWEPWEATKLRVPQWGAAGYCVVKKTTDDFSIERGRTDFYVRMGMHAGPDRIDEWGWRTDRKIDGSVWISPTEDNAFYYFMSMMRGRPTAFPSGPSSPSQWRPRNRFRPLRHLHLVEAPEEYPPLLPDSDAVAEQDGLYRGFLRAITLGQHIRRRPRLLLDTLLEDE